MQNIFLKLVFNILKILLNLHNDLTFLRERMKIIKVKKLATNFHNKEDEEEEVIHTLNLKQALHYGLLLNKIS